jgi:hypothetical protein
MSSETRKKAWSYNYKGVLLAEHMKEADKAVKRTSSMHHPSRAALKYSSSVRGRLRSIATVSTTDMPRLSFPPGTL